jgi:hypothetical protein
MHISQFHEMRGNYDARPKDLTCPECSGTIVPVLPPSHGIADHFRHQSESSCLLSGESALHFNAKVSLAQEMSKFRKASLVYSCQMCGNWYPFLQIGPYDRVIPEMKVAARRPDVTCLSGGTVVGLAEILNAHAVDFKKKNELNATGCPWFEIPAINVHRQFFKFVQSADVFSINARGAAITYPTTPRVCEVCAPEEARRARNWAELERQSARHLVTSATTSEYDEWRKMADRRRAQGRQEWSEYKASLNAGPEDLRLGARLEAEGIIPEVDRWGIKPSTPRLDGLTYIHLVNERKERWLAQNRTSKQVDIED